MTTVGIVSDTDELLIKYRAFGYRETIIPVDDFDTLEEVDILAICFDNDNWLLDTMEWLISVRQHPAIYTWVLTPQKATIQEKEIFLGLGAISVLSIEDSSNSIIYSIRNTYYKLSDKDYQNQEIEFLQDNTIIIADQRIQMTSTEYKVLHYLFEHINKTVVYEEIYHEVWSNEFIPINSRTKIANIISRLRKIIENSHNIKIITIRDTGYMYVEKNKSALNFNN